MMILRSASALAVLTSIPFSLWGQDRAGIEGTFLFSGVSYPSIAGDFRVVQAMRWEDPAAGVQLTYVPEGVTGTYNVYVYPAEEDLEREVALALQGMAISANRVGEDLSIDSTRTVEIAGLEGELAVTRLSGRGRTSRSLVYVFRKRDSIIKYRLTYDPALRVVLEDRISEFLRTTLSSIASIRQ